jgi:hypothetical protein
MNTRDAAANEFTTAQLNGYQITVRQAHRRWAAADYLLGAPQGEEHEPVLVTVTAPVRLSLEDVVAALFDWGMPQEELADDEYLRLLVAETVINRGGGEIEELRCRLGEQTLDAEETAYLAYCRDRAAAVFAPRVGSRHGRALVGVD